MEEKRRGPGRPRKNENEILSEFVKIRLSSSEKEELVKLASRKGVTLSDTIRHVILEYIKRGD